jgi:hypothetical protein
MSRGEKPVGAWVCGPDGVWHASVEYDGYTHELLCGYDVDVDRVQEVELPRTDYEVPRPVVEESCCEPCYKEVFEGGE